MSPIYYFYNKKVVVLIFFVFLQHQKVINKTKTQTKMILGLTITTFMLALCISFLLMPPFITLMQKYHILDKAGGRHIHTGYTAHMGGIVIFITFVLSTIAVLFLFRHETPLDNLFFLTTIVLIMLIVGIRDDLHNISAWSKLFIEIFVGIFLSYIGIRIESLGGFLGIYNIPLWFSYLFTTCFFIVVVNAYNLIDGVDGQAGMQAINVLFFCVVFLLTVIGVHNHNPRLCYAFFFYVCCISMSGAIVGFLRYNWQKAKIFMGDAGSLFIGTMLTCIIIVSMKYAIVSNEIDTLNHTSNYTFFGLKLKATIAPFLNIFYLPMADTLRVFINRARHDKSPFHPDKTHIHHLFLRIGFSHQRCTLTTFSISFCISALGIVLAFLFNDNICIPLIIISWFVYVKLLSIYIKKHFDKVGLVK